MSKTEQRVLVAGATGTTGRIIIDLLQQSNGYAPVAMVRKQDQKDQFKKDNVAVVLADLEEELDHALFQIDKVIFAAGSNGKNVISVDQEGAKRLIDASKKADVEKFVMLSSMGAENPSQNKDLEAYLEAKKKADEHLRNSGLTFTIVRPGRLTDENRTGHIQLDRKLDESGKISRADVAQTLAEVLESGVSDNQTFEILEGDTPIEKAVR